MRIFLNSGLIYSLFLYSNILLATPPGGISYINNNSDDDGSDQSEWSRKTIKHTGGGIVLNGNRELEGLVIHDALTTPIVNLSRYTLCLGKEGIVNYSITGIDIREGYITSYTEKVFFGLWANTGSVYNIKVSSVISDHENHKVGLKVAGEHTGFAHISIEGDMANSFTGKLEVEGVNTILDLRKKAGVISVRGNAFVRGGATVNIWSNGQMSDRSSVTLMGSSRLALSSDTGESVSQRLKGLCVTNGGGIVQFTKITFPAAKRYLYLDDLIVSEGEFLTIQDWQLGVDFLLVRKDGVHLADSLRRVRFAGYDPNAVHLEDFNAEYWQILGTPEPATYGVIFGALGLGVVAFRRYRARNRRNDADL